MPIGCARLAIFKNDGIGGRIARRARGVYGLRIPVMNDWGGRCDGMIVLRQPGQKRDQECAPEYFGCNVRSFFSANPAISFTRFIADFAGRTAKKLR